MLSEGLIWANLAMLGTSLAFFIILLGASLLKKNKTMMPLPYISFCSATVGQLALGVVMWIYTPDLFSLEMYKLFYVLDVIFIFGGTIAYYWYVDTYLYAISHPEVAQRKPWPAKMIISIGVYGFLVVGLNVSSLFIEWAYSLRAETTYYYPPYILLLVLSSALQLAAMVRVLRNRKRLGAFNTGMFVFYALLPVLAFAMDALTNLALGYVAGALCCFIIYVRIDNAQGERLLEQKAALARKEAEMADIRMDLMMSQIQPHFLYNALSSIAYLCTEDPAEAEAATNEFSNYLRGNLQSIGAKTPIPFESELSHVEQYLRIEQRRFGSRLIVHREIQTTDFLIPALTLQTLVENAVKYSVSSRYEPTTVSIASREEADAFIVTIVDDGPGFDTTASPSGDRRHIGIEGSRARMKEMTGGSIDIQSIIGQGTTVTIRIPKERKQ